MTTRSRSCEYKYMLCFFRGNIYNFSVYTLALLWLLQVNIVLRNADSALLHNRGMDKLPPSTGAARKEAGTKRRRQGDPGTSSAWQMDRVYCIGRISACQIGLIYN